MNRSILLCGLAVAAFGCSRGDESREEAELSPLVDSTPPSATQERPFLLLPSAAWKVPRIVTSTSATWLHGAWTRGEDDFDGFGRNNFIHLSLTADGYWYRTGNRFEGRFCLAPAIWTITFDEQRPDCFRFDFSPRLFRYDESTRTLYDAERNDPIERVQTADADELPSRIVQTAAGEHEIPRVSALTLSIPRSAFDSAADQLTILLGQPAAGRVAALRTALVDRNWSPLACVTAGLADEPFRMRVLSGTSVLSN